MRGDFASWKCKIPTEVATLPGVKSWTELGILSNSTDITGIKLNFEAGPKKTYLNFHLVEDEVNAAVKEEINNVKSEIALATTTAIAESSKTIANDVNTAMSRIDSVSSQVDNIASKVANNAIQTRRGLLYAGYAVTEKKMHSTIITNAAMQIM